MQQSGENSKSRIPETLNLLTFSNSSPNTKKRKKKKYKKKKKNIYIYMSYVMGLKEQVSGKEGDPRVELHFSYWYTFFYNIIGACRGPPRRWHTLGMADIPKKLRLISWTISWATICGSISSSISCILKLKFKTIFDRLIESKFWDDFWGDIGYFGEFGAVFDNFGPFWAIWEILGHFRVISGQF